MTGRQRSGEREHKEISALLPWYVNGSIGEQDRRRVDAHLTLCAGCRDELSQERRIHEGMSAAPSVEYMPAASLKRLQARLDAVAPASDTLRNRRVSSAAVRSGRRRAPRPGLLAASVALAAVGLSLLAADGWVRFRTQTSEPRYRTVTTSAPRPAGEVIRAVFAPNTSVAELQAVLDEAQLRIVSGPTEAGVYSLAATSGRPVNTSLALLRADPAVRFAESTQPNLGTGDTP